MKKGILLTLFSLSFIVEDNYGINTIGETEKTITLKRGELHQVEPKSVGVVYLPIHATIDETIIEISFDSNIQDLTIYIENEQGEIVYDNTLSVLDSTILPISIEGYNSGYYVIEIKYGNTTLYGKFSI